MAGILTGIVGTGVGVLLLYAVIGQLADMLFNGSCYAMDFLILPHGKNQLFNFRFFGGADSNIFMKFIADHFWNGANTDIGYWIYYASWIIFVILAVLQVAKLFYDPESRGAMTSASPGKTVFRIVITASLLLACYRIATPMWNLFSRFMEKFINGVSGFSLWSTGTLASGTNFIHFGDVVQSIAGGESAYILACIMTFSLATTLLTACISYIERYMMLAVSAYLMPVTVAMFVNDDTEQSLKAWAKSILGQMLGVMFSLAFMGLAYGVLTADDNEFSVGLNKAVAPGAKAFNVTIIKCVIATILLTFSKDSENFFEVLGLQVPRASDGARQLIAGAMTMAHVGSMAKSITQPIARGAGNRVKGYFDKKEAEKLAKGMAHRDSLYRGAADMQKAAVSKSGRRTSVNDLNKRYDDLNKRKEDLNKKMAGHESGKAAYEDAKAKRNDLKKELDETKKSGKPLSKEEQKEYSKKQKEYSDLGKQINKYEAEGGQIKNESASIAREEASLNSTRDALQQVAGGTVNPETGRLEGASNPDVAFEDVSGHTVSQQDVYDQLSDEAKTQLKNEGYVLDTSQANETAGVLETSDGRTASVVTMRNTKTGETVDMAFTQGDIAPNVTGTSYMAGVNGATGSGVNILAQIGNSDNMQLQTVTGGLKAGDGKTVSAVIVSSNSPGTGGTSQKGSTPQRLEHVSAAHTSDAEVLKGMQGGGSPTPDHGDTAQHVNHETHGSGPSMPDYGGTSQPVNHETHGSGPSTQEYGDTSQPADQEMWEDDSQDARRHSESENSKRKHPKNDDEPETLADASGLDDDDDTLN